MQDGSRGEHRTLAAQRELQGFESEGEHSLYAEILTEQKSPAPLAPQDPGGSCRVAVAAEPRGTGRERAGSGLWAGKSEAGNKNFGHIKSRNVQLINHTNPVI